jgi:hypothetical protein
MNEIDAIARPKVDLQLHDARANASRLAWVSLFQAVNPRQDLCTPLTVSQIAQPCGEFPGAKDLYLAALYISIVT